MGWMILRSVSLCGLMAAFLPASAQDADRKVSFSMEASRASVLLPALGKAAGLDLRATTRMSDEILIVNVHDVPVRDLLAKIAEVSQGEWKVSGNGYELSRSSSLQTSAERAELSARSKRVQTVLDAEVGRVAKLPAFDAAEADRQATEQQKSNDRLAKSFSDPGANGSIRIASNGPAVSAGTPSERGIIAILQAIGATSLASMTDGQRVVFSSNANRMQHPLPGRASDYAQRFAKDSLLLATANQKLKTDDTRQFRISGSNSGEVGKGNPALGVGKSILIVQRFGNSFRASLIVADPNGMTIASGEYTLALRDPNPTGTEANLGGDKIALSPLATEFANVNKQFSGGGAVRTVRGNAIIMVSSSKSNMRLTTGDSGVAQVAISPDLKSRLLQPETFDPQSLAVTEGLNAVAAWKKENLVADVSDDAILPLTRDLGNGVSPQAFLQKTCPSAGISIREKDGWLIAQSRTPVESRFRRMDRSALGQALRGLDGQICLRLKQVCAYAIAQPKPAARADYDGLSMCFINAAGANEALNLLSQADVLRFYASLTPAQQSVVESGRLLALNTLTPNSLAYLTNEVFQSQAGPVPTTPQGQSSFRAGFAFSLVQSLDQERTEYLPQGIPNAGTLLVKIDQGLAALGVDAEGKKAIYTPDMLASRIYQEERTDLTPFGSAPKLAQYLPAGQTQMSLHFEFPQTAAMDRDLTDTWIDRTQQAVAYNALPGDLKSKVDECLQNMRNNLSGVRVNFVGAAKKNLPPEP